MFGRDKRRRERLEGEGRRVPAEVVAVEHGRFVRERTAGLNSSLSVKRTVRVRVAPPGEPEYEAELKLGASDPLVPEEPGARFELLVGDDPRELALPADPLFTMPNGVDWRPPVNAGIGRAGEAAALAEIERIREAAKRASEGQP